MGDEATTTIPSESGRDDGALQYAGQTSALERPREIRIRRFCLRVASGPDRGDSRESSAFEFSVGTAPGNDLVLTDGTVSRHHCAIIATPDGFLLRDLQSTNGTILGEHRIQSAFLRPLAVIRVGRTAMVFESVNGDVCELWPIRTASAAWSGRRPPSGASSRCCRASPRPGRRS